MVEPTERIAILLQLEKEKFEKNAKSASSAIDRLERKLDPLAAAEAKLAAQQKRFNAALEAGTLTAKRHATGMELLQSEYAQTVVKIERAQAANAKLNASLRSGGGFLARHKEVLRQGGYQFGDFAVQVQGGQSVLTAFSQQGSQLAGFFGAYGAVFGAFLAIVSAGAAYFMKAAGGAMKFEDALKGVQEVASTLQEPLDQLGLSNAEMTRIYGSAADKVRELILVQSELRVSMAEESLQGYMAAMDGVIGKYTTFATGGHNLRNTLARLREDFGLSKEQAIEFEAALQSLSVAGTLDDQKAALQDILGFIEANNINLRDMPPALQASLDEMISLSNESDKAAEIAAKLEESDYGSARLSTAASEAQKLADWLGIALSQAIALSATTPAMADEDTVMSQGVIPDAAAREGHRGAVNNYNRLTAPKKSSGRKGGRKEQAPLFTVSENELQKLQRQIEMLGKSKGEIAALTIKHKLLDEAKKRGLTITEELASKIDAESASVGQLADEYDRARDKIAAIEKIQSEFKDSVLDAAMGGVNAMDAFTNSIKRAALEYLLFGEGMFAGGGGKGGGWGGILGGLSGLLAGKRANGGGASKGGAYLVNENTPNSEIFVPSQSGGVLNVPQAQAALRGAASGGGHATIVQSAGDTINITVKVEGASGDQHLIELVHQGVEAGLTVYDRKVLPGRISTIANDPKRRG